MRKILFDAKHTPGFTIMIFAEGTILKPQSRLSLYNHNSYVPIGNAVKKTASWQNQGANIIYCTSRKKKQADDMADLLRKYGFTGLFLAARETRESYQDIVETIRPDILIEDDCRSIGGAWQMCITKVKPEIKRNITSIAVPEFKGIDALPDSIEHLKYKQ